MLLTKDGVTWDVSHPVEIARLKKLGFTQEKEPVAVPAPVDPVAPPVDVPSKSPDKGKGADKGKDKGKDKVTNV